jgi:hypothetical protein
MFVDNENTFVSLDRLSRYFDLPKDYLRELADKNLIPFLNVKGYRRFNPITVEKALSKLAKKGDNNDR